MKMMNSLCALALGFVLDMALGDLDSKFYPLNLMKRLIKSLEFTIRGAYEENDEAQTMAGIMLVFMTLLICLGSSVALLLICYNINAAVGIIAEGLLCWFSLSIKSLRKNLLGVFRASKADNEITAKRYLTKFTNRDIEDFDIDECVKCAVEEGAENTVDWIIGPVFWIAVFGGIGGIFCRCINILDSTVGYRTIKNKAFGKVPAKIDDVVMFVPARIASFLMWLDVAFLKLDTKGASEIYKRDKRKSPSPNSGCTEAVCAGALDIQLGGDVYYDGEICRKSLIGDPYREITSDAVFWVNQLVTGTSAYGIVLIALIKTLIFIISRHTFV